MALPSGYLGRDPVSVGCVGWRQGLGITMVGHVSTGLLPCACKNRRDVLNHSIKLNGPCASLRG